MASSVSAMRCTRPGPDRSRECRCPRGSNGISRCVSCRFQPLVPIQTELRGVGKGGAELDEERHEVAVDDLEIVMIGHRRRANDRGVGLPLRVLPTLLGAEDAGLLLGLPDKQDALLSRRSVARYSWARSSFRCPFSNVTRSSPSVATKRSIAWTNRSLIGATTAVDGTMA